MEPECLFCGEPLALVEALDPSVRMAFDPRLGRLWQVCPACTRWNLAPFEARWEAIEVYERRAHAAKSVIRTEHLALLADAEGQLIRVGAPALVELADWRYSSRIDQHVTLGGRVRRAISAVPEWPAGGYDFYGTSRGLPEAWIGSPFIGDAAFLTTLFLNAPLADRCPACDSPLFIHPAAFGDIRLQRLHHEAAALVPCGLCGEEVVLPLAVVRPALRSGLALVSRNLRDPDHVERAARPLGRVGDSQEVLRRLCVREDSIGELPPLGRLALWIVLDEIAEAEALENEWRTAEGLARIADGELTTVPGFEEFRHRAGAAPA